MTRALLALAVLVLLALALTLDVIAHATPGLLGCLIVGAIVAISVVRYPGGAR